jgi:hypothetical protein
MVQPAHLVHRESKVQPDLLEKKAQLVKLVQLDLEVQLVKPDPLVNLVRLDRLVLLVKMDRQVKMDPLVHKDL